jgi:uroporphyrinogen-III decarboxylase
MTSRGPLVTEEPLYQERVEEWEALWRLDGAERPRWMWSTSPSLQPLYRGGYPLKEYFQDKEMQLAAELETLEWRERLGINDLFVPFLQPMGGVTVFASAFGCKVDHFAHTLPWAHAVIKADEPAERVYDLPEPSVTDGQLGEMLEFTDYFVKETGGRYPIAQTDLQGPLDTAYLVWDSSSFMMAMRHQAKEVHHLMRLVTDLIIRYIKEQRARSPQFIPFHYPPLWLRDGQGIAISDDGLAVLSPQTYEEFALPYANELSEEFGGIFIHSCGNFAHQLSNLEKVHKLRGLNFGASEMPFEAVWEHFNGRTVIVPHLGLNKDIHFENRCEYVQHILNIKTHNRGLLILLSGVVEGMPRLVEIEPIRMEIAAVEALFDR